MSGRSLFRRVARAEILSGMEYHRRGIGQFDFEEHGSLMDEEQTDVDYSVIPRPLSFDMWISQMDDNTSGNNVPNSNAVGRRQTRRSPTKNKRKCRVRGENSSSRNRAIHQSTLLLPQQREEDPIAMGSDENTSCSSTTLNTNPSSAGSPSNDNSAESACGSAEQTINDSWQNHNIEMGSTLLVPSVLGHSTRYSIVVTSKQFETVVLILWSPSKPSCAVRVVPVIVGGLVVDSKNGQILAKAMEPEVCEKLEVISTNRKISFPDDKALGGGYFQGVLEDHCRGFFPEPALTQASAGKLTREAFGKLQIPVGSVSKPFDLFRLWWQSSNSDSGCDSVGVANKQGAPLDSKCLICMEDIPEVHKHLSNLVPCGHGTCLDCWREYVESAAASGQGSIVCPAFKCKTRLCLLDIAQILFAGQLKNNDDANAFDTFSKMVRFELDRFVSTHNNVFRFCPSLDCGRVLGPSRMVHFGDIDNLDEGLGWEFYLCDCGGSVCLECPDDGPAHPGCPCGRHAEIRNAASWEDRRTLGWLLENTKPCPSCRFPIYRYEGCNHVWCDMCNTYFCWVCGGPGQECNAYECFNGANFAFKHREYNEEQSKQLLGLLEQYDSFLTSAARFTSLRKTVSDLGYVAKKSYSRCLELDGQIHQAMHWLNIAEASKLMGNGRTNENQIGVSAPMGRLELLSEALSVRKLIITRDQHAKMNGLSLRKEQWQEQRQRRAKPPWETQYPMTNQAELERLCTIDEEELAGEVKKAVCDAINHLVPCSARAVGWFPQQHERCWSSVPESGILNEKAPRREPWRNGLKRVDSDNLNGVRERWKKCKQRVKIRRSISLSR